MTDIKSMLVQDEGIRPSLRYSQGLCKCIDVTPSIIKTPSNCGWGHPGNLCRLCNREAFSITNEGSVVSFVSRLIETACPSVIIWRISQLVINPIKRLTNFWFAHIVNKIFELTPTRADRNTSTAIINVERVARVGAPLDHVGPYGVDPASGATMGAVVAVTAARAATRHYAATRDLIIPYRFSGSALALKYRIDFFIPFFTVGCEASQFAEFLVH